MKPGKIWWEQIGSSLRLLDRITTCLQENRSVILQHSAGLPWCNEFYASVDYRRSAFSGTRRMMRRSWSEGEAPGEFLLNTFCSDQVQADYWPGQSYAEYLGSRNDILLCDYYVWIYGIHSVRDLEQWINFIVRYNKYADAMAQKAVFVLEYDGEEAASSEIDSICYSVEMCDCRVFSLEAASELANTPFRDYQAELALRISGHCPELCYALLRRGEKLLQSPVDTVSEVCASESNSAGDSFPCLDKHQITFSVWEASLVQMFPIIERFRMKFIEKNESALRLRLPVYDANGDQITDPHDLEIGVLSHIVSLSKNGFSEAQAQSVRQCRKIRNLLAHIDIIAYEDVKSLYEIAKTE